MPVITSGRLSMATSLLALTVAIGGTGYAAVKIGTKDIENNAVTSPKVKKDTLTGKDIKESSLGVVPGASSVNKMVPAKVLYRSSSATPVVIYSGGGLVIKASCPANDLALFASTTKDNSSIVSNRDDPEEDTIYGNDLEDGDFELGDEYDLLEMGGSPNTSAEDPALVDFVYRAPDKTVITGHLATDTTEGPSSLDCIVFGTVLRG